MHDTEIMNSWHYAFFKICRTSQHWVNFNLCKLKSHLGGWGIPEWNADYKKWSNYNRNLCNNLSEWDVGKVMTLEMNEDYKTIGKINCTYALYSNW